MFKHNGLNQRLESELHEGERVLWSAENIPVSGGNMAILISYFGVSVIWLLLVGWGLSGLMVMPEPQWVGHLTFSVLAIIIFGLVAGPWLIGLLRSRSFAYAVTDRRIFVMNSAILTTCDIIEPDMIEHVSVTAVRGKGTIFLYYSSLFAFDLTHYRRVLHPHNRLMNVPDAENVADLIRKHHLPIRDRLKQDEIEREKTSPPINQGLFKPTKWS